MLHTVVVEVVVVVDVNNIEGRVSTHTHARTHASGSRQYHAMYAVVLVATIESSLSALLLCCGGPTNELFCSALLCSALSKSQLRMDGSSEVPFSLSL